MTIEITTQNNIVLDGKTVARFDGNGNLYGRGKFTTIYTGERGKFDQPHQIEAAVYVGDPSNWTINPEFETAVRSITNA